MGESVLSTDRGQTADRRSPGKARRLPQRHRGQDLLVQSLNELHFKNTDQRIYNVVSGSILPTMTRSDFELAAGGVALCHGRLKSTLTVD